MKKFLIVLLVSILRAQGFSQNLSTVFEKSNGLQTATYSQCIEYYSMLKKMFGTVAIKNFDTTDSGYPLQLVMISRDKKFNPAEWHRQHKIVILINNGIHPGEPDGIDASMMFSRDVCTGKFELPDNVALAIIPIYNIGGSLNRNEYSRVNENGPVSYGFRGNSQNLDLNRDFIKADSRNAIAFEKIFHWLDPDILIDNHVSDGADYQYTMTMLTTQHNKLGGEIGRFLHETFEPELYRVMEGKNFPMVPYVNFEEGSPENGWVAFYDPPRYSSGYAALFETIAFVPETHMLKPFAQRVKSTYAFLETVVEKSSIFSEAIIQKRKETILSDEKMKVMPVSWKVDSTKYDLIQFKGYETGLKTSDVTGKPRLFYDHARPYEKQVRIYNTYEPSLTVRKPVAYVVPHGWEDVVERLKINGVKLRELTADTTIIVEYYHIDDYRAVPKPYEKHHFNYNIHLTERTDTIRFLKGDYLIYTGQTSDRYIVETLEPLGDDSFFKWNFFDAILQEKEGYSDYRWEDVAAGFLKQHPEIKEALEEKKKSDSTFANSVEAQLYYVYTHSPYYEPEYLRYPVYKIDSRD